MTSTPRRRVAVAGGHGKIARLLQRRLVARGEAALALVRDPDHVPVLQALGAEAAVADLEHSTVEELAGHLRGADAVVFAAGAGPGSGPARKQTVDRDGAILLADAAETAGVGRYVLVSARDPDRRAQDEGLDPVFAAYLRAKAEADREVAARSALEVTIVRPGRLSDEPGTGRVRVAGVTGPGGIPREDVAEVLLAVLDEPATAGHTFEVVAGDTPVTDAVAGLVGR